MAVAELLGHRGCVNRLSWNESGTLLASVSDDTDLIIRKFSGDGPFSMATAAHVSTGHTNNIFGVAFLPDTNDTTLVTGAMDSMVRLHQVRESGAPPGPAAPPLAS